MIEEGLKNAKLKFEELKKERFEVFKKGFDLIAKHVKQIYRLITDGGDADLETID